MKKNCWLVCKCVSSNPRTSLLHFFEALFAFNVIFTTNILMSAMSSAVRMAANMSMKVRVDTFASTLRARDFTNLVLLDFWWSLF